MQPSVEVSDWKVAPFAVDGEAIYAVGDVHGCAAELHALLDAVKVLASKATVCHRRLVYLGDLIDRGPDTLGVLRLWATEAGRLGVDEVDRLIGNHEIMLLLAISDFARAETFKQMWLTPGAGGEAFLKEMRAACRDPIAPPSYALTAAALGERTVRLLLTQRPHLRIGNTLFVHGGIDPRRPQAAFLATPWTAGREAQWAWINRGFLDWKGGFGGTLVVHGHTPPEKHFGLTGMQDPHVFHHDRLSLDGGSARTGVVVAAEIQDGRYRVLRARAGRYSAMTFHGNKPSPFS